MRWECESLRSSRNDGSSYQMIGDSTSAHLYPMIDGLIYGLPVVSDVMDEAQQSMIAFPPATPSAASDYSEAFASVGIASRSSSSGTSRGQLVA